MGAAERDEGFTLVELMVVLVIVGILIAIAIPLYLNYENGARNKTAASDVRGAVAVIEACHDDLDAWPADITGATDSVTVCPRRPIRLSPGNTLTYTAPTSATKYYLITVVNGDTGKSYTYESDTGHITSP